MQSSYRPVLLVIVDGLGTASPSPENAVAQAKSVMIERLAREYQTFLLQASGPSVGLAEGAVGNSEQGHVNMSAGRIVAEHSGPIRNCLPEVISAAGLHQFYVAETKKFGHLSFHFNGSNSNMFPETKYELIQASHIVDYAKKPYMRAPEIAQKLVSEISQGKYEFYVANFANIDMVAHTGNRDATIEAVHEVDHAIEKLVTLLLSVGGVIVLTSDHGNGEHVVPFDPNIMINHTTNPVPCVIIGADFKVSTPDQKPLHEQTPVGPLSRVAPTILQLLGVQKPPEMDQQSLLS